MTNRTGPSGADARDPPPQTTRIHRSVAAAAAAAAAASLPSNPAPASPRKFVGAASRRGSLATSGGAPPPKRRSVADASRAHLLRHYKGVKSSVANSTTQKQNMAFIVAASFAQLLASITYAGEAHTVYSDPEEGRVIARPPALGPNALSLGVVSAFFGLVYFVLALHFPTAIKRSVKLRERFEINIDTVTAVFLPIWWGVAQYIVTFVPSQGDAYLSWDPPPSMNLL